MKNTKAFEHQERELDTTRPLLGKSAGAGVFNYFEEIIPCSRIGNDKLFVMTGTIINLGKLNTIPCMCMFSLSLSLSWISVDDWLHC